MKTPTPSATSVLVKLVDVVHAGPRGEHVGAFFGFDGTMAEAIGSWVGRTEDEVTELGQELFTRELAGALFYGAWRLMRAHRNRGHTVVILTSGTWAEATPLARALGVEHVLCTRLETDDAVLTGRVAGRPRWGPGKFTREIDLRLCHVYADGDDDVELLARPDCARAGRLAGRGIEATRR